MKLFDDLAERFTRATDHALQSNNYVRGQLIIGMARRAIPAGGLVLDYGCGPGRLSQLLAREGYVVRGVDISEGMLAEARKLDNANLNLTFQAIASMEEALPPNFYDAIICSSVIEYVPEPEALLHGFHRALRSRGALVISYANQSSLWRRYAQRDNRGANPMYKDENRTWRWREFRDLLGRAGFRTVRGPIFFESPFDWYRWSRLLRWTSLVGTIGVLEARPIADEGDHLPSPRRRSAASTRVRGSRSTDFRSASTPGSAANCMRR